MSWYYACKVRKRYCIYQRNLYFRELTHGRTGSPEHPKENSRYMHTWDDIMHVKYAKVLYLSKESILQGTHAWPNWFARTIQKKIADVRPWDDIMHVKYAKVLYLSKESISSANSSHGRTGSPEHPKENSRYVRTWDDIMLVKYAKVLYLSKESIFQWTHAWPDWFARTSKRK